MLSDAIVAIVPRIPNPTASPTRLAASQHAGRQKRPMLSPVAKPTVLTWLKCMAGSCAMKQWPIQRPVSASGQRQRGFRGDSATAAPEYASPRVMKNPIRAGYEHNADCIESPYESPNGRM
jgi:hypothetical protein